MCDLGKCFLCGWVLEEGEYSKANYRTEYEAWRSVKVCKTCAKRAVPDMDSRFVRNGEPVTVRVDK